MAALVEFLRQLLTDGEVTFHERPTAAGERDAKAVELLRQTYLRSALDIAGPRIDFRPDVAVRAGDLVRHACWFLVNHDEPAEEVERRVMLAPPQTPADHLSGDLVLRFLPQLYRRARALAPADALPRLLATVLRQWPLSGVLSEVAEGPLTPLEFGGHPGLLLLYAERLAQNEKAEWLPHGEAAEYVRLVYRDLGKQHALFLAGLEKEDGQGKDHDDGP